MIIAETVLTLRWMKLFEVVWTCMYEPFQDDNKSMILAETALTLSRTMLFGIVCKRTHASTTPEPSISMIIAETVLALSWVMLFDIVREHTHQPRPIKVWDYSWGGACIAMDDAIRNRLQTYTWSTPRPAKSTIIAEAVLMLSWTMLQEIVCKNTHDPPWHINVYDYHSWEGAYVDMDDAFWNR